jgi:hypothetical protein
LHPIFDPTAMGQAFPRHVPSPPAGFPSQASTTQAHKKNKQIRCFFFFFLLPDYFLLRGPDDDDTGVAHSSGKRVSAVKLVTPKRLERTPETMCSAKAKP